MRVAVSCLAVVGLVALAHQAKAQTTESKRTLTLRIQPTFPMGASISTEKARTAALFQKPTKILEDAIVGGRTPLLNVWSAPLKC